MMRHGVSDEDAATTHRLRPANVDGALDAPSRHRCRSLTKKSVGERQHDTPSSPCLQCPAEVEPPPRLCLRHGQAPLCPADAAYLSRQIQSASTSALRPQPAPMPRVFRHLRAPSKRVGAKRAGASGPNHCRTIATSQVNGQCTQTEHLSPHLQLGTELNEVLSRTKYATYALRVLAKRISDRGGGGGQDVVEWGFLQSFLANRDRMNSGPLRIRSKPAAHSHASRCTTSQTRPNIATGCPRRGAITGRQRHVTLHPAHRPIRPGAEDIPAVRPVRPCSCPPPPEPLTPRSLRVPQSHRAPHRAL